MEAELLAKLASLQSRKESGEERTDPATAVIHAEMGKLRARFQPFATGFNNNPATNFQSRIRGHLLNIKEIEAMEHAGKLLQRFTESELTKLDRFAKGIQAKAESGASSESLQTEVEAEISKWKLETEPEEAAIEAAITTWARLQRQRKAFQAEKSAKIGKKASISPVLSLTSTENEEEETELEVESVES